jgi:hypothetical protein
MASILIGLGLLFLVAAAKQKPVPRTIAGLVAIGMGAGVVYLTASRKTEVTHVHKTEVTRKIDLSGDINLDDLKCRNCGAVMDLDSVEVRAGAVFVNCRYCGNDYQVTEEPIW